MSSFTDSLARAFNHHVRTGACEATNLALGVSRKKLPHRIDGLPDDGVLCRQEWGGAAPGPAIKRQSVVDAPTAGRKRSVDDVVGLIVVEQAAQVQACAVLSGFGAEGFTIRDAVNGLQIR